MIAFKKAVRAALPLVLLVGLGIPAWAVDIVEVEGPQTGVSALLVEDRSVPIVTLRLSFRGGSLIEKEGEEGLVELLSTMMNEGAGDLTGPEFQERLDELGIRFFASAGRESFRVGVSALETRFDEAIELLALALNDPRFDAEPLGRMKEQLSSSLRASRATRRSEVSQELRELIWGDHPYARPSGGEPDVIEAATADDLRGLSERLFARDNAVVGAVGAIDPEQLASAIDRVFADLQKKADTIDVPFASPTLGLEREIALPGSQAAVQVTLPAPMREDEDFFAAYLVNHVLGGGTFTSRLYEELREKRGLTYGAGSSIATYDYGANWSAGVQTRPDNVDEVRRILLSEIERMAREGPTKEELERAKAFVKGSYAINNLNTSRSVAGVLLAIQEGDLGLDYIDRREDLIDAVTIEDAKAAAAKYLGAEPTVIVTLPAV